MVPPTAAANPPGLTPGGGQSPQPQQAPFGASPATGPTPNKGYEAQAAQRVGAIVKAMTDILPLVGATSDLGRALMKAMTDLGKHVPPGSTSNAGERNQIEKMAMQNQANGQMMQQAKQSAAAPQGAPPAPQMPKAA